ncbi:hypothetical protein, partial [Klebsiella pneumoniae]|uniref:hypothetical protein n=1 Tax=Klebsiella pneumoniae TaxID=573 RepID=UPI001C83235E
KHAYCLKTQPATGETYPKSDLFNKATHIRSNRTVDGITVQYSHASRYLSCKKALLWRFPSPLAIRTFSFPQAACLA